MSEEMKEIMEEEIAERKNPFCVISLDASELGQHNIQMSSAWGTNPYPDTYAVVPDEMVPEIRKTRGFCDIAVDENGMVVEFIAREIPTIPEPEEEPAEESSVWDELDAAYQEGVDSV